MPQLVRLAKTIDQEEAAVQLAKYLSERLTLPIIPVKLKALQVRAMQSYRQLSNLDESRTVSLSLSLSLSLSSASGALSIALVSLAVGLNLGRKW